jgi:hypothetical protein
MPASHFDVKLMTGRPKFIVRHSTCDKRHFLVIALQTFHMTFHYENHDKVVQKTATVNKNL